MSTLNAISSTLSRAFGLPQAETEESDDVDVSSAILTTTTNSLLKRNLTSIQPFPIYHAVLFLREPMANGWYRESVRDKVWFIFNSTERQCDAVMLTGTHKTGYQAKLLQLKYDDMSYGQIRAREETLIPTTRILNQLASALRE